MNNNLQFDKEPIIHFNQYQYLFQKYFEKTLKIFIYVIRNTQVTILVE